MKALLLTAQLIEVDSEETAATYAIEADRSARLNAAAVWERADIDESAISEDYQFLGTSVLIIKDAVGAV